MSKQHNFLPGTQADLDRALQELARGVQEKEAQAKAASMGLPYIDLHNFPIDLNVLGIFLQEEAKEMQAVPFYKEGKDLRIAVTNPKHALLVKKIPELSKENRISLYLTSEKSFQQVYRFYSKVLRPKVARDEIIRVEAELPVDQLIKDLKDEAEQKKKTAGELLQIIFGAGIFYKASDIHLEPEEHFLKLRFRIDGVLQDMLHFTNELKKPIITRIKIATKLKLNIENIPQDGRITFYYLDKPVDVRVSSLPSAYGEELVMRLLGTGATGLKLKDLGFRPEQQQIVEKILAKPNGMVVTTGPTGSGKTTSLYAFLNELNEPGVKIITLEDPVEYKLEGVVQTPIDHNVDFDFAKGLRAILRQDPDIVMVGEIRDQETAEVAMQAALTGHMVLSTLHTNDAPGAVPRLLNMGVKAFVVAPALSCVIAQRLVRRLCENCKKDTKLSPQVLERVLFFLKQLPGKSGIKFQENLKFFHSTGCAKCNNLGYQGRIGIYEVLENTEKIQKLIFEGASTSAFKQAALQDGMITMLQDGLLKASEGITDVEEVFRVAGEG